MILVGRQFGWELWDWLVLDEIKWHVVIFQWVRRLFWSLGVFGEVCLVGKSAGFFYACDKFVGKFKRFWAL